MSATHCHRCGRPFVQGELKYEVAVRVRSMFDGVIPECGTQCSDTDLDRLLREMEGATEEELNRQVYEDDIFVMCPQCKEAFMETVYAHIQPEATPEHGRAHLIH